MPSSPVGLPVVAAFGGEPLPGDSGSDIRRDAPRVRIAHCRRQSREAWKSPGTFPETSQRASLRRPTTEKPKLTLAGGWRYVAQHPTSAQGTPSFFGAPTATSRRRKIRTPYIQAHRPDPQSLPFTGSRLPVFEIDTAKIYRLPETAKTCCATSADSGASPRIRILLI